MKNARTEILIENIFPFYLDGSGLLGESMIGKRKSDMSMRPVVIDLDDESPVVEHLRW